MMQSNSAALLCTLLFGAIFLVGDVYAQSDIIVINSVEIIGNKKTKSDLIYREMDLKIQDSVSLALLTKRFERNRELLMNTGLFNSVEINIKNWDDEHQALDVVVTVVESWYIFPLPIFSLADRNFNVWWTEFNRSLKRVNYGIRFVYVNFTGNKDNLKMTLQGGYTRRFFLQYERPYFNRNKTLGFTARYFFDHKREFAYTSIDNKLKFYEDLDQINFKSRKSILSIHYRPGVVAFHEFLFKLEDNLVNKDILDVYPRFFNGKTALRFFEFNYIFVRERRDSRFYPLKGNRLITEFQKIGWGIFNDVNQLYTSVDYAHYVPIRKWLNLEMRVKLQREWTRGDHPYYGLKALGYGEDYLRGYEFYVMDGTDFILSQNALRFKLFEHIFDLKKKMPVKNYRMFPVELWFTLNGDLGKSYNYLFDAGNTLTNKWIFGRGIGIDMVLYRKYAFQIQYSFNDLQENGVFLHIRSDF